METSKLTPMMRQYRQMKEKYPDAFLFFRLGDFYEMFFEDAVQCSRILNLTLTKRHTTPMCGVPYHAVENYLGRLTKLGKKVAICEQLSDPSLPGIVERDVVRVVTPGTTFDERILDQKANNFIIGIAFVEGKIGFAACDATTGFFCVASFENEDELRSEIFRTAPSECVIDAGEKRLPEFLKQFEALPVFPHQFWDEPVAYLAKQFGVKDLAGFGISEMDEVAAAGALLINYLAETQKSEMTHIKPPQLVSRKTEMVLDETAIRNLELLANMKEGKREGSLLSVIDMTRTSMGGRMLRSWLLHPLNNKDEIENRLDSVAENQQSLTLKIKLPELLNGVLDLERLLGRLTIGNGNARDMLGIALSLKIIEPISQLLSGASSKILQKLKEELAALGSLTQLREKILNSVVEAPPLSVKEGGIIRDGVNAELDDLRKISREGKSYIQKMQEAEIARTGINSLKIKYNSVFGYYIEVTRSNLGAVPADYIRKQTLVNAERFITPELKEYEEKVLGAEEKTKVIEYRIFAELRETVKEKIKEIQSAAQIFAMLDVLVSFALVAEKNRYTRPQLLDAGGDLFIKNGRHPVVESLAAGQFVPNDIELTRTQKVMLLTGPNMGGKSTYLRQTALIVLMAHMGCFVPAENAKIPLTDRIFTRVGASDNLVRGQSTFMVEMQEAAQILHYATPRSLIILDEIGRGTSTYDGVSLAWAILEYIHDTVGAKTLFATHYHELIQVADKLSRAANFSVAVCEEKGGIVFLYRVLPGAIDRSYGIEVARLAGLPRGIISKAKNILNDLEEGVLDQAIASKAQSQKENEAQLDMFSNRPPGRAAARSAQGQMPSPRRGGLSNYCSDVTSEHPHRVIQELNKVDVNDMTPMEALKKLDELRKMSE